MSFDLFTLIGLMFFLVLVIILIRFRFLFRIRTALVHVSSEKIIHHTEIKTKKYSSAQQKVILEGEATLRKIAYADVSMSTSASFYDNTDLTCDYYITLIYDKKTGTPLLSSRLYFDQNHIEQKIKGNDPTFHSSTSITEKTGAHNYEEGKLFLIDRLSAHSTHPFFKKHRSYIFTQYYRMIYRLNRGRSYFLMVRRDTSERLLTKYLRVGLLIIGRTLHHNIEHWILLGDLETSQKHLDRISILNFLLLPTRLFGKH